MEMVHIYSTLSGPSPLVLRVRDAWFHGACKSPHDAKRRFLPPALTVTDPGDVRALPLGRLRSGSAAGRGARAMARARHGARA